MKVGVWIEATKKFEATPKKHKHLQRILKRHGGDIRHDTTIFKNGMKGMAGDTKKICFHIFFICYVYDLKILTTKNDEK